MVESIAEGRGFDLLHTRLQRRNGDDRVVSESRLGLRIVDILLSASGILMYG